MLGDLHLGKKQDLVLRERLAAGLPFPVLLVLGCLGPRLFPPIGCPFWRLGEVRMDLRKIKT
jgi:hypothetical protein